MYPQQQAKRDTNNNSNNNNNNAMFAIAKYNGSISCNAQWQRFCKANSHISHRFTRSNDGRFGFEKRLVWRVHVSLIAPLAALNTNNIVLTPFALRCIALHVSIKRLWWMCGRRRRLVGLQVLTISHARANTKTSHRRRRRRVDRWRWPGASKQTQANQYQAVSLINFCNDDLFLGSSLFERLLVLDA